VSEEMVDTAAVCHVFLPGQKNPAKKSKSKWLRVNCGDEKDWYQLSGRRICLAE
jgi:hypothetical protein